MRPSVLLRAVTGLVIGLALSVAVALGHGTAQAGRSADVVGAVGQPVMLDNEQVHTVVRTERWYGGGFWFPKAGQVAVAAEIHIKTIAKSSYNPMYYAVRDSAGTQYGRVIIGYRYPSLPSTANAPAGTEVDGWLTFLVPTARVNDLTLEYHMHGGFGSTLRVNLGAVPDSQRVPVGANVSLAGEQVHRVTSASVWPGKGLWKPKAGYVYVTWYVNVKALKQTTIGGMHYSLRSATGEWYHGIVLGNREPRLPYKAVLAAGRVAQGWVTEMVPKSKLRGLTIVYHLHDNGPNLLIPFTSSGR
jgi:hypothetical protein